MRDQSQRRGEGRVWYCTYEENMRYTVESEVLAEDKLSVTYIALR